MIGAGTNQYLYAPPSFHVPETGYLKADGFAPDQFPFTADNVPEYKQHRLGLQTDAVLGLIVKGTAETAVIQVDKGHTPEAEFRCGDRRKAVYPAIRPLIVGRNRG